MIIAIDVKEPFNSGAMTVTFVSQADKGGSIDIATSAFALNEHDNKGVFCLCADKNGVREL